VNFLSYEDWKAAELVKLNESTEEIECRSCEGEGEKEEECDLGHWHETECEDCDGAGSFVFKDLPRGSGLREEYVGIERYEELVLKDARQLAAWTVRDVFEVLVDAGFQPWMRPRKSYEKQIFLIPYDQRYRA
jgi:hypothetical protein